MKQTNGCTLCPRMCGADRASDETGVCGAGRDMYVARVMLHRWEEPCLGKQAGAIFFSGCPLGCVYCQNRDISRPRDGRLRGEVYSAARLADEMLRLAEQGADCIDLVSPTQYTKEIREALLSVKPKLRIPVVWNTGGYERAETVASLDGLADIFLTDFKYGTPDAADAYSGAPDYPDTAAQALREMYRITGDPLFAGDRLKRGIILRHLVLPGGRRDSAAALRLAAKTVPPGSVILSLMRQYTPDFAPEDVRVLRRRVTTFEYESVLREAISLGYDGYSQEKESASAAYTPDFLSPEGKSNPADKTKA